MDSEISNIKELLEALYALSSKIFIIGHNEPDFDSIGSAIGLQSLCTALGKEAYIVINDPDLSLEPGVKKIKERSWLTHNIINMAAYENIKTDDSALIVVDTNKKNMTCMKDKYHEFEKVVIIDHHQTDQNTISPAIKYIKEKSSSASEIVTQLITNSKIQCNCDVYTYLLAGIILDTKRFKKNTTPKTHEVAEKLMRRGANIDYINELFLEEFDDDKRINDLVFNGTLFDTYQKSLFETHNISFTLNRESPATIYRKEDIAKAADKLLKYRVDASFVLGYVAENAISVSARSKSNIDVGKIMSQVGGGGNSENAGARVENMDIKTLEEKLKSCIGYGLPLEEHEDKDTTDKIVVTAKQFVKV